MTSYANYPLNHEKENLLAPNHRTRGWVIERVSALITDG